MKNKNNERLVGKFVKYIIIITIICLLALALYLGYAYSQEAITQKEFSADSKGNCRIVNTKLAYDNNYKLRAYRLTKLIGGKVKIIHHVFALKKNDIIVDISNGGRLPSYNGVSLDNFPAEDVKAILIYKAGFKDGKLIDTDITDWFDIQSYLVNYNTWIYSIIYSYSKNN